MLQKTRNEDAHELSLNERPHPSHTAQSSGVSAIGVYSTLPTRPVASTTVSYMPPTATNPTRFTEAHAWSPHPQDVLSMNRDAAKSLNSEFSSNSTATAVVSPPPTAVINTSLGGHITPPSYAPPAYASDAALPFASPSASSNIRMRTPSPNDPLVQQPGLASGQLSNPNSSPLVTLSSLPPGAVPFPSAETIAILKAQSHAVPDKIPDERYENFVSAKDDSIKLDASDHGSASASTSHQSITDHAASPPPLSGTRPFVEVHQNWSILPPDQDFQPPHQQHHLQEGQSYRDDSISSLSSTDEDPFLPPPPLHPATGRLIGPLPLKHSYDMQVRDKKKSTELVGPEWSSHRLKMPFSASNRCYLHTAPDTPSSKWDFIRTCLTPVRTTRDLEIAIKAYNPSTCSSGGAYAGDWIGLHQLTRYPRFESKILPYIIKMALKLPELVPEAPPMLFPQTAAEVAFDQKQCVSLVANMFLCTFPRRLPRHSSTTNEYSDFPDVHFAPLFLSSEEYLVNKLYCLCAYFDYHRNNADANNRVCFRRMVLKESPDWKGMTSLVSIPQITANKKIEDIEGVWQADFANKSIGGGVLGRGAVQEEIRFCVSPELFVSRLITSELASNEAMLISGSMKYCTYTGYSTSFKFSGAFNDVYGLKNVTEIVAFDAIGYKTPEDAKGQFMARDTLRELEKATVAFAPTCESSLPDVATGRWGCGAFNGNVTWKFLIQMLATSAVGRTMQFCTLSDANLTMKLEEFISYLKPMKPTIAEIYELMSKFDPSKLPSASAGHGQRGGGHRGGNDIVDPNGFEILPYIAMKLYSKRTKAEKKSHERRHPAVNPREQTQRQPSSQHHGAYVPQYADNGGRARDMMSSPSSSKHHSSGHPRHM